MKHKSPLISSDLIATHPEHKHWDLLINRNGESTKILNVGSGSTRLDKKVTNLDVFPFPNVDIVADAHSIPLPDNSYDSVWIEAVLEHVKDPIKVVSEIYRVLKPGGYVFAVVPFVHKYHEHPNDYQRYTLNGLDELFHQFKKVESGVYRGPTSALISFLADYTTLFTFTSNKKINFVIRGITTCICFPLKFLDKILVKNKRAHELSNALYYLARKES